MANEYPRLGSKASHLIDRLPSQFCDEHSSRLNDFARDVLIQMKDSKGLAAHQASVEQQERIIAGQLAIGQLDEGTAKVFRGIQARESAKNVVATAALFMAVDDSTVFDGIPPLRLEDFENTRHRREMFIESGLIEKLRELIERSTSIPTYQR